MSGRSADVVIVGGGIVGAACAYECAAGGLSVTVIEESVIGGGATAAGMGHIVVMDDSEAQFQLTALSERMWNERIASMPAGVEHLPCGTLWVAADEEEMAEVRRKQVFYAERGLKVEVLDGRQLAEAEPHLRKGMAGGLLVPGDSVVYPPVAAHWMLKQSGATVVTGLGVSTITDSGAKLADGTMVSGAAVVNAAGGRSVRLTAGIPVAPRKGHLVITDRYPGFVRHQLIELGYLKSAHSSKGDSVAFNAQPRKTGQVLIGSSRQYGVEHSGVDRPILRRMLSRAAEYMPEITGLTAIRTWTGFRAATPDKLPLIGPVPGTERVWLATGHEGLGITTSLGTGRLLADLILGRPAVIPAEPYLPGRCMHA
ncbi:FAD-dependent oxidoreductase [uncultured Paludibaculum sp.]|uniref:NAD(P)/FAD-dependent oxidoreductase n=1 Tax=uncultured Paludibaculum sp. TaxID=1765020 RepID=UPI002AAB458A|nr:FAD-dependent oxidoreductase [uncultured Paludibaculum sp.]